MPSAKSLLVASLCGAATPALGIGNGGHYHDQMQAKAIAREAEVAANGAPKCIYDRPWEPKNNPSVLVFLYHAGCPASDPWPIAIDPVTKQCTDSFFVDLAKGCKSVLAVLNPCRGPYPDDHPNQEAMLICSKMLSDAGVEMVGYTHTKVTKMNAKGIWTPVEFEPMPSIFDTMDRWSRQMKDVPNFKGFFLDDTTNHIDTKNMKWGVNHTEPYVKFVPEFDEIETFKKAVETGQTIAGAGVHTATREFAFSQAKVAHEAKLKYFYATDRNLSNDPWRGLPSFWEDYLRMLADGEDPIPTSQEPTSTPTATTTPSADSSQQVQQSSGGAGKFAPTLGAMLLAVSAPLIANAVF